MIEIEVCRAENMSTREAFYDVVRFHVQGEGSSCVLSNWGRIGTNGQINAQALPSTAAREEFTRLVRNRVERNYNIEATDMRTFSGPIDADSIMEWLMEMNISPSRAHALTARMLLGRGIKMHLDPSKKVRARAEKKERKTADEKMEVLIAGAETEFAEYGTW